MSSLRLFASTCVLLFALPHALFAQEETIPPGWVLIDDMILPEYVLQTDSSFTATPWPLGVVAYTFNANVSAQNQAQARKAMAEISAVCGVVFVPRTNHPDWITFNASTVNNSPVGMMGGGQTINITSWGTKYIIVHEIMHSLGFIHEQSRPDRNTFVTINYGNVSTSACTGSNCTGNGSASCVCNFNVVNGATPATSYDFLSIMHYGRTAFSTNGLDTISCNAAYAGFQTQIGNNTFMSLGDAQGLQQRYGGSLFGPNLTSISPTTVTTAQGTFTLHVYGANFFEGSPNASGVQGSKIVWNGTQIPTTYVDAGHLTAQITPELISHPQTAQITVTNPPPAWGPLFATLPLSIICQSGGVALANGVPTTITNGCQGYSITPVYDAFNVVAVSSASDWDIQMGTAFATAGGNTCDFVAGGGWFGPGTIQPTFGNVTLYSGSAAATLQHVTSTEVLNGQPTIASLPAGSIVRAFHFSAAAVSTRAIQIAGPTDLRWKLLYAGSPGFSWRSSTTNVTASGQVGAGPVTGIGIVPAPYCLVVYRDGVPSPTPADFTITMCFDFTPTQLVASNFITTINQGPYSCVPFTITPLTGRWNVVGVSSPSDWDLQIGPAVSQNGGSACDYVLSNGHLGTVWPVSGVCSPFAYPGSSGSLQFAPTATMPSANSFWNSYAYMMVAFEFEVVAPGTYDINVGAPGYSWNLHGPGTSSAWSRRNDRLVGGAGSGVPVSVAGLVPGWYCVVVFHDGGPTGLTNPSISVGYSAIQTPVLSSIAPSTATAGGPGFTITATGNGFVATSVIRWNGNAVPTTFVSATTLRAVVAPSLLTSPTTGTVTAFTPGGGASASLPCSVLPAAPILASLSPLSTPIQSPTFPLSVFGSGFNATSIVLWNGAALPTAFVSATELSATVDATLTAAVGSALVSVDNPGGGMSGGQSFAITYGNPAYPPAVAAGLEPVGSWSATSMGLPTPLGGISFTPNGATLLVGARANHAAAALYAIPVDRDPVSHRVTGLGAPAVLAPAPNVDGGVVALGATWLYTRYPLNEIGEFNGTTTISQPLPPGVLSPGGIAIVPPGLPNAGTVLVSSFNVGSIYSIATSPAANGFVSLGSETLFATLPPGTEGIAFIPYGPFAGDLLVADYNVGMVRVMDISPSTGLPVGGAANPSLTTIIPSWIAAEGVAVDPVTGELWITQFGDRLVQIAGLESMATLVALESNPHVNAGASITFRLRAGTARHDRPYILAGSLSGSSPGTPVGSVVLPLNVDALTLAVLDNLNTPLFSNFASTLDANGAAGATLAIPPGLGLATPLASDLAYVLLTPVDFASSACHVTLVP